MEAFYVCIIFLGVLLILVSLFLIMMDRVNGKDFFKEFDRKKEEMFTLIQDSEEMVEELNRMSDYVVSVISEKNQEFFTKHALQAKQTEMKPLEEQKPASEPSVSETQVSELVIADPEQISQSRVSEPIPADVKEKDTKTVKVVNSQFTGIVAEKMEESNIPRPGLVLNGKRREVMRMIEQGLSNDEIAEKMKIGKGEIGLIRGLSKQ